MVTIEELMKILEQVAYERKYTLYDICFRAAGVGIQWFDENKRDQAGTPKSDWKVGLGINKYYKDLRSALEGELDRLRALDPALRR